MKHNTPLIQLRNGDWIDPRVVKVITAGRNARPYIANGKEYQAYVRIETFQSAVIVPCEEWNAAMKFRDALARICNERMTRKVEKATATNFNGREAALVDPKEAKEELKRSEPAGSA